MSEPKGRKLALSLPRRTVCDLLHFAHKVPTVPVQRRMNIAPLLAAREASPNRPSWCAIFTKAYGIVCAARPELRRAFLNYPWPHLYEHPSSIASIAVERRYRDENAVFFVHMRGPERLALHQLDAYLKECKERPVESIGSFRRALWVARLPRPGRRFLWWCVLNWMGYKRARRLGTFGVTAYSGLGAQSLHPLSPLTTVLNYGVIDADGDVDVHIVYDHRVMDGPSIARALGEMEKVLNEDVLAELQGSLRRTSNRERVEECESVRT